MTDETPDQVIKDPKSLPIKRALLSVANKTGLADFANALIRHQVKIVATKGTLDYLHEHGIDAEEISDFTGVSELLEGRVKTLHPKVHGGILAKRDNAAHLDTLSDHDILPIDMVVVNLQPFTEIIAEQDEEADTALSDDDAIDKIDIGGPAMIRSAAKNYNFVSIVTDPADYKVIIDDMDVHGGAVSRALRARMASHAFALTATYDSNIASWFVSKKAGDEFPPRVSISGTLSRVLRHGENQHQQAALYCDDSLRTGIVNAKQLQGPRLSYNNILDGDAGFMLVSAFDAPTLAFIKHGNPCGVASADSLVDAYQFALACDPLGAWGGIVAVNAPLDSATARLISKKRCAMIIAPSIESEAIEILKEHEALSILTTGSKLVQEVERLHARSVSGGFLLQDSDIGDVSAEQLRVVSERPPTEREMSDLLFAFKVNKYVDSNAIVYAKDGCTVGIGAGQMSRIDAAYIAAEKAKRVSEEAGEERSFTYNSVVASDGYIANIEVFKAIADVGVTAIIQPGGAPLDNEVIAAADDRAIAMVFTDMRHFKH